MEYHHKESTHNNKKTLTGCDKCWELKMHCQTCNGVCVFSSAFFKSCEYNKKNRKSLQAKCFKEDFDILRESLLEKGEYDGDVQADDEYEVLKALHESDDVYDFKIWKKHNSYDLWYRFRSSKSGVLTSTYSVKGRCHTHRTFTKDQFHNIDGYSQAKTHKRQEMTKFGGDFVLRNSD